MASHLPVNHHMRGFWRALSFLAALYILIFGIVGTIQTNGMDTFATHGQRVLGLTANPLFAIASIVVGAILLAGTLIGRGIDVPINIVFAVLFVLAGLFSLGFLRTDLNYFGFSVANCILSYIFAIIFGMSSMYGRVSRTNTSTDSTETAGQHAAHA